MRKYLLIFSLLSYSGLCAISIVYNFRIAQITKQPIFEDGRDKEYIIVALLFDQYIKKHNHIRQNFLGGLSSFIYDFKSYYFRTDFAVSSIQETRDHVRSFSDIETDDILFTFGRNFMMNHKSVVTLSGLFGIPTHEIFRLKHVDFGYGQIGTGIQFDGSYTLNQATRFLYGTRYIYFVPRRASDVLGQKFNFTRGNISDVLVACKNTWNKHGIEFGYTFRANFGAHIHPHRNDIVKRTNYLRSNFYSVYKYKFLINNISNRLLFNFAYGFDHRPKLFGDKHILTFWASWNIGL